MDIYEQAKDLYQSVATGEPATLWYRPTSRSRKMRKSSLSVLAYQPSVHDKLADQVKLQNGWSFVQWQ